jgi:hypothetical protein
VLSFGGKKIVVGKNIKNKSHSLDRNFLFIFERTAAASKFEMWAHFTGQYLNAEKQGNSPSSSQQWTNSHKTKP